MEKMNIALIGLAVMGQNLVLNMERNGYSVAVYNRTATKTNEFIEQRASGKNIKPAYSFKDLANMLERPRKVMIMVKAGEAVDETIAGILPLLDKGDIIIDGGNSHFLDTRRRSMDLEGKGFLFIGTGVSGGEEGALNGPCIMPGGTREAYNAIKDIFLRISAKVDGIPCCAYMGPADAGHFVKIVHNGIEYADMQLIAESYNILRYVMGLPLEEIREIFLEWNEGDLGSYLMEITSDIFKVKDPETGNPLLDMILDEAEQKGTGKWTSQAALDMGVPIPSIDAALFARNISHIKEERVAAAGVFSEIDSETQGTSKGTLQLSDVRDTLLCSRITAYTQGMALLHRASVENKYNLNLSEIAQIWKGGCIIRSKLLEPIKQAFIRNPNLHNLYLDSHFSEILKSMHNSWRKTVSYSVLSGIPCPAISASLQYFDSYRSAKLPANLIQAQRDYFGAHTYRRIDREGIFHTEWIEKAKANTTS